MKYFAVDLFSGCGGLSAGMVKAGFNVRAAIDNDTASIKAYQLNHPKCNVIKSDIRKVTSSDIKKLLGNKRLHLLAGCPPCQGFSSIRRRNNKRNVKDKRNDLILEYLRFIKKLKPLTIMMENVSGLINYNLFKVMVKKLESLGYGPKYKIVDIKDYGIPQRRKRLVLIGSLLGNIDIPKSSGERVTVRNAIGDLESVRKTNDPLHKTIAKHTQRVKIIISLIPKNGGSRSNLPKEYRLKCHAGKRVGFNDIYGRLRWNDYSSTITGGCLNPSKGRFLHPIHNRCITAREAALLQTFPKSYKFPTDISKTSLALLIGNALPPKFGYIQAKNIKKHLDKYLD